MMMMMMSAFTVLPSISHHCQEPQTLIKKSFLSLRNNI